MMIRFTVDTGEATAAQASWPVLLAAVALSFALAVGSHYLVEQPMRHADRSCRAKSARATVLPCWLH